MINKERNQLMHIYKRSQILTNWLWMITLSGDEEMVQQDIEWAQKISLQIAEGLFGYTGIEKNEMARMLSKAKPAAKARAKAKSVAKPAARKTTAKKAAAPKRAKPAARKSVRAKAKTE